MIIGGRLGHIIAYNPENIFNVIHIISIWNGGMSFHGGLLGVGIAIYLFAKNHKVVFFTITDMVTMCAPIGLFFGRIANFINGELYGKPSLLPWSVIFPHADMQPRHPSQIYEALTEGVVIFCIMMYCLKYTDYLKKQPGKISAIFLMLYSIFRIAIEQVKETDNFVYFITMGQALSIPMLIIAVIMLSRTHSSEL